MIQDTSQKAFREEVVPTIGPRQEIVLQAIIALGAATNSELSSYLGWPINTVTPRVFELRAFGKVVEAGKRRCKVTGRTAYQWEIKPGQQSLL